ncbi:MAG: hypothetical protein IJ179_11485 [Oscillospiraceae bacterium]|nr:hypothetical protein [Oscillospiraceae bacterium]MBQ9250974.1 hypothetical protein [Oscillospiraceae bacterium]
MKKAVSMLLGLVLVLSMGVSALAEDYGYTVRIYAGAQGSIGGKDVVVYENVPYLAVPEFDIGQVTVKNEKYYVKGLRESGRDNDTVAPVLPVTRDIDYVVAYGIKGSEVAYTVRYVSYPDGKTLAPSVTYYGNVGDKPVVAYKFIDGYRPRYYNLTGTLQENAAENAFTFEYVTMPVDTTTVATERTTTTTYRYIYPVTGNRPATAPQANAQTNPESVIEDVIENGPEAVLDMDVPLAGPDGAGQSEGPDSPGGQEQSGSIGKTAIGLLGAGAAALLGYFLFLLFKRRDEHS